VVFTGNGGAKQGHNAIAQHLIHRTLKAVHSVHHALQGRIEELLGGFRIKVADQFGGAFEVSEQHSDLLALAFHSASGGEDFLDQVGWRVCQRRWCCGWWGRGGGRRGRCGGTDPH
jgi:hypothetical protein